MKTSRKPSKRTLSGQILAATLLLLLIFGATTRAQATGFTITVQASPAVAGTVTGGGSYTGNSVVTNMASANPGYQFVNWTSNGVVVSTNATYVFIVTSNAANVANFASSASDFTYAISNGTVAITGYIATNGTVVIPATIAGLPVTYVSNNVFNATIQSSLTSVTFPNSVTGMGNVFSGCLVMTNANLGNSLTNLADYAFQGCAALTNFTIPASVTYIGQETFENCVSLGSIAIPDSVGIIGDSAFNTCARLTNVIIGAGLTNLTPDAFFVCSELTNFSVSASNAVYRSTNGVIFDTNFATLILFPNGAGGAYTVPSTVTRIGDEAFDQNLAVTSVVLDAALTEIGTNAFEECTALRYVPLPGNLKNIRFNAFDGCLNLTNIVLPNSVTNLEGSAFSSCDHLTNLTMGENITNIQESICADDTALVSVTLSGTATNIGAEAFYGCAALTHVTIPPTVVDIGYDAFQYDSVLLDISIPDSVTNIEEYAFFECHDLTNVTFGTGLVTIGEDAFEDTALKNVSVPEGVTSLQYAAFYDILTLTNVTVPASVTDLGSYAFADDSALTTITFLGNAPPSDGSTFGYPPFDIPYDPVTVYYEVGTTGWSGTYAGRPTVGLSPFTFVTNGNGTVTITGYTGSGGNLVVPTTLSNLTVTAIGTGAFLEIGGLVTVTIPATITNIGVAAFQNCGGLTAVYFQGNAPAVDPSAFSGDTNAIAYYEPGATGWSGPVGGIPAYEQTQLTFANLHSFSIAPLGTDPQGELAQGTDGNFYGTTLAGGTNGGYGVFYRMTPGGTLTVLHTFTGGADGGYPYGGLVLGPDGNFYGTASAGGGNGQGVVFKITQSGVLTVLYSFTGGDDGGAPEAGLTLGLDGSFYGTTFSGGASSYGTVFKITTNGALTSLYSFQEGTDAVNPSFPLVQNSNGLLYGVTREGGTNNIGAIYVVNTNGVESVLHSFTNEASGIQPVGRLALGTNGNYYGMTETGGSGGRGTIFEIATNGVFTLLYSFGFSSPGVFPDAGLTLGPNGTFYGTLSRGGLGKGGNGAIFTVTGGGSVNSLYSFTSGNNGALPNNTLLLASNGTFYGTTYNGGPDDNGSIFSITATGNFTPLAQFYDTGDGSSPSGLINGGNGNFYGATSSGGMDGNGTVYRISTTGAFQVIYAFTNGDDGANPDAALVRGADGNLYGTTVVGGDNAAGTIFQITTNGVLTNLYTFQGNDGANPEGALIQGNDGYFYGTTSGGGDESEGTVFRIKPDGTFKKLYSFTGGNDGSAPGAGLIQGANGLFYGSTESGANGFGTIFTISSSGALTTLYLFTNGVDGGAPSTSLAQGIDGNLYGATAQGGESSTIFSLTPGGSFTALYVFPDTTNVVNELLAGTDGNLYGTVTTGGAGSSVFELNPNETPATLYTFSGGTQDGGSPVGALVQGSDGSLYGTTASGCIGGNGGIFRLSGTGLPSPLPVIVTEPSSVSATPAGFMASFIVYAGGAAPLSYQWFHNGVALADGGDYSGANLAELMINAAAPADAGTYSVVVSNLYSAASSSNVSLTLLADTNTTEYSEAGTNYIDVGDYILANQSFSNALSLSPTNSRLQFYEGATGLLALFQEPAGSNFLNRLGISTSGRDLFNWQADGPTNANGHLIIPHTTPPLNADEFTAQLYTNILPALLSAEGNLIQITNTNFTLCLTSNETHGSSVTVDWGDVQMLQAMGQALELFIYETHSWNLNVQLLTASNILRNDGGIEGLLTNYPSLLTTTSTADLPAAKTAFTSAITNYFTASEFIRSRPTNEVRLFNLDPNKAQEEFQFRETLSNLLASLNGPVPLTVANNYTVSAQALFGGNFDLRNYLPSFDSNDFLWDSFPDPTFGGIISGLTEQEIGARFHSHFKAKSELELPGVALSVLYNITNFSFITGLVQATDGNLYGTMTYGGPFVYEDDIYGLGWGSVFRLTTNGQFSTIYNFGQSTLTSVSLRTNEADQPYYATNFTPLDGAYPNALVAGTDGNLYGTTQSGGVYYTTNITTNGAQVSTNVDSGTIFKITTLGHLTTLHDFGTADNGAYTPMAALTEGSDGQFYGTTEYGGGSNSSGIIFSVSTNGVFQYLNSFTNPFVGGNPFTQLVEGTNGAFYGTTPGGGVIGTNIGFAKGSTNLSTNLVSGYGTIFELTPSHQLEGLYTFGSETNAADDPIDGVLPNGVVFGSDGYLYGTTQYGGSNDDNIGAVGFFGIGPGSGDGTLFRLSPTVTNSFSVLYTFDEKFPDGYNPAGLLVPAAGDSFYGLTTAGGGSGKGAVFYFNPTNGPVEPVAWLDDTSGDFGTNLEFAMQQSFFDFSEPLILPSLLAAGNNGLLYGVTTDGGADTNGTIFALNVHSTNALPGETLLVNLTSPGFSESVTTPATLSLEAEVIGGNLDTQVYFHVGTNVVGPSTLSQFGVSVSNTFTITSAGSYPVYAVASNINGLTATSIVTHVTANAPGTMLIDFEALDATGGAADPTEYLAGYGITISNVTGGTEMAVQDDQNIQGGSATAAHSGQNLLTQSGANGAVSYTLAFSNTCTSVSWWRTELLTGGAGIFTPEWTAYALDPNGNILSQVGEEQFSSITNVPAAEFTLYGSNIAAIVFKAVNDKGAFDNLPLDDLLLSTNPISFHLPSVTLTTSQLNANEPGQVVLQAQAAETGGSISRIDFYKNSNLIGSATSLSGASVTAFQTNSELAAGSYTFYAVATDANGVTHDSSNLTVTIVAQPGVSVIDFDTNSLDTFDGAVGGIALSNYLTNFGVTIGKATPGTRLEAINENSFSGNELPVPVSLPNLFTQVGLNQPVTFTLFFATNEQSFTFTRVGIDTNGQLGISHPAWSAHILDASGNELESVSEPLLFSLTNIPPKTFTLIGSNIASARFNSDSQQTAAFSGVLLDSLILNANPATNPFSITLQQPAGSFTAPATIPLAVSATDFYTNNIAYVAFYSGSELIGILTNQTAANTFSSTFNWSNILNGAYTLRAQVVDSGGYAEFSSNVTVTVTNAPNSTAPFVVNFDALNATAGPVTNPPLAAYLATNDMAVSSNSPGTSPAVEDETNVAGGGFVTASSEPNLLTQIGSNGPASFTVTFSNLLTGFSFTRPELLANPFVTHPAWQVEAFDALGLPLAETNAAQISSPTNVPAQTYTLDGDGIASVQFSSQGSGLTTFNAMLLDDFVLTEGITSNLAPAISITNPLPGQVFTTSAQIPLSAVAAIGNGSSVASVTFYFNGTNVAGLSTNLSSPFNFSWTAPSNGIYLLTAVATNSQGLSRTSAPVTITIATGFAIVAPPTNETVVAGNPAVFSVTTSTGAASYQWNFNGNPIAGATSSVYVIASAQTNNGGLYTVTATPALGSPITSTAALLTVLAPPMVNPIVQTPSLVPVPVGTNVTLSESPSGTGPFTYQWRLNGTRITGATTSSLTISNVQALNAGNYRVVVGNGSAYAQTTPFTLQVAIANSSPTTNINFASSKVINPLVSPVIDTNSYASTNISMTIAGKPAGAILWYNWTASFTGVVSLTTLGSSFDTLMGIYTGATQGSLVSVGEDDDSGGFFTSLVTFNCQQGVTYQIAVGGYRGATGTVVLGLASGTSYRVLDPNSGDAVPVIIQQPASAIVPSGAGVSLNVVASNATSYQWYFAGAPIVYGTNSTLLITNFSAAAVGNYYVLAANSVGVAQSTTVAIQIAAQNNNGTSGTPTNLSVDKFGDAVDLTSVATIERVRPSDAGGDTGGFTLSQSFSTIGATKDEGEPNHAGQPGGASYWYSYTATNGGTLIFTTTGSTFNTILAVYTGSSFANLVDVGSAFTTNYVAQGQPIVTLTNVVAGTLYYIAVDGYQGASGNALLSVSQGDPPTFRTPPESQTNIPGSNVVFSAAVVGTTNFAYQWQFNGMNLMDGGNISGALTSSLTLSSVTMAEVGSYTVVVSNMSAIVTSTPPAVLTLQSSPLITGPPLSQIVPGGQPFTNLTVTAIGVYPLYYQWFASPSNAIAGATNDVLAENTPGTYFVIVSNAFGTAMSSNVILSNGVVAPSIITNSQIAVAISSPANNATETTPSLTVKGTIKGNGANTVVQVSVNNTPLAPIPVAAATRGPVAWTAGVTLSPGANVIIAQGIGTNGSVVVSPPVSRTVFYPTNKPSSSATSTLTLTASPSSAGTFSGQKTGANLELNKVYTVKAIPARNYLFDTWTMGTNTNDVIGNSASLTFIMTTNLWLQANLATNPFTTLLGTYNGLFSPLTGITEESSGFFSATMANSASGAYSAKLMLDGGSYSFSGNFDLTGSSEETVARTGKPPVAVVLNLDLATNMDQMTGFVINFASNGWTSVLTANRAVFGKSQPATAYAGKYTLVFPPGPLAPTNQPGGYGYATLANSTAGVASISGSLADNTPISQSVAISKSGSIPLYVSLYSKKGSLMGWLSLTNATTNQSGQAQLLVGTNLAWIKTNIARALYPTGFTNTSVTALGSLYTNNFTLSGATLTISNAGAAPVVVSNVSVMGGKFTSSNPAVQGTITASSGLFTLTIKPPLSSAKITAKGVLVEGATGTNGAGWFLGNDGETGLFLLQP